ncbi:MAG: UDP-N-acetylmuramoyl-L-alanine--D-glutamate ligase [Clostridia bacterium]|nr:UDP-N-acetylmuramoyl-L-alanine--D-glutamate ligase [Clostridia bacterium]
MYLKKDKFLVVGMSKSGTACAEFLLKRGAVCYVYDDSDSPKIAEICTGIQNCGGVWVGKKEVYDLLNEIDVLVLSPGVAIDHDLPIRARKLGKRIIGEMELAYNFCKSPIIAVTGTNGKTTTCTMIDSVLKNADISTVLCGNIGKPLISTVDGLKGNEIMVVEASSFQLETASAFTPHVAVITNVTPDHLSRHYNMENYVFVKSRILANLKESEYAVLCYDDPLVQRLAEKTRAKILYFSAKTQVNGSYVEDGKIYFKGEAVAKLDDLPIKGEHNILNFLATLCVAKAMGLSCDDAVDGIKQFKGVKHRIQHVATVNGVEYVNDSKATNIDATCKAIDSMSRPTVLILGGKDKGIAFDGMFEKIKNSRVKSVVVTGESRYRLLDSAKKVEYGNVSMTEDFYRAIDLARLLASEGDCVLLSPSCSSFDKFNDFEHRGDEFIRYVESFNG